MNEIKKQDLYKVIIDKKNFYEPQAKQRQFHGAIHERGKNGYRDFLYGGAAKGGKLIPIDTLILTASVFKKLMDIHPGDFVYSDKGKPVMVVWESEVENSPDAYEIEFDTGEKISADANHLWKTFNEKERAQLLRHSEKFREKRKSGRNSRAKDKSILVHAWTQDVITKLNRERKYDYLPIPSGSIRTTKEIFNTQRTKRGRVNHTIQNTLPIQGEEKSLLISPYLLGLWLGDGHLKTGKIGMMVSDFESICPSDVIIQKKYIDKRYKTLYAEYTLKGLRADLASIGVLNDKRIPNDYLRASFIQRLELLQGILDTDGHCDQRGSIEIGLSKKDLAEDVHELICSLGIKCSIRTKELSKINPRWKNHYRMKFVTEIPVFKLIRKSQKQNKAPSLKTKHRSIISVKKSLPVPMKCIQVENEEGMFLIGRTFLPTHNSYALRWEAHWNCIRYPRLRILLIRSSFPELSRTHFAEIIYDLPPGFGKFNRQDHVYKYNNGSVLEFGYGSCAGDFSQYLSANYDAILIDELTTIPFELSYMLRLRLQASRKDFIPFFAAATNPGNIAHVEVRSYFVKKDASPEKYPNYDPKRIFFLPATVYDNEILLARDPDVLTRLQQLPLKEQQKYLYGNWDIFEGQFFDNWNPAVHIIKPKYYLPYDQLLKFNALAGVDYGNQTVFVYMAKDYNGNIVMFDEIYMDRMPRDRKIKLIKNFESKRGLSKVIKIADSNMWIKDAFDVAATQSPAAEFINAGINLIPVSKRSNDDRKYRINCNDTFYNLLDYKINADNGLIIKQPKFKVYERCRWFIETFPALIRDEHDVEDIASKQNDHPYDAAKYCVMSLTDPIEPERDNMPMWLKELEMKNESNDFMAR